MAPPAATCSAPAPEPDAPGRRRRVGIAMLPTKAAKHLRPELIEAVGKAGYEIVPVVPGKLAEAGRLDALLHKIRTPAWKLELEEYSSRNPDTLVLDPPDRVAALQSRATMLAPLQGRGRRFDPPRAVLDAHAASSSSSSSQSPSSAAAPPPPPPPSPVVVAAPAQVVIPEGASAADALAALAASGLSPPLLAKPLHAGTTACGGSHALALLDDVEAVAALAEGKGLPHWGPPVVLQPYVRHPAPLFKVFVMGPLTVVARRPSLRVPPPPGDVNVSVGGAHSIARVSAYVSAEDGAEEMEGGGGGGGEEEGRVENNGAGAEEGASAGTSAAAAADASSSPSSAFFEAPDPPQWALEALAAHLRTSMGLNLFNFDLITVDKTLAPPPPQASSSSENGGDGSGCAAEGASPSIASAAAAAAAPPDADYLVIDINYFPGFEKLPDYEGLLIEFLAWLFRPRTAGRIRAGQGQGQGASGGGSADGGGGCVGGASSDTAAAADTAATATAAAAVAPAAAAAASAAAEELGSKLRVEGRASPPASSFAAAAPAATAAASAAPCTPSSPSASAPSTPSSYHSLPVGSGASGAPLLDSNSSLATASSAGSSPLRGTDSAASLQKLARSLSQRPVTFPRLGGGGGGGRVGGSAGGAGIAAAAAAAVARRDKEDAAGKEGEKVEKKDEGSSS